MSQFVLVEITLFLHSQHKYKNMKQLKVKSFGPINNRLKGTLRTLFDNSIFHGGEVFLDDRTGQKKFRMKVGEMNVPFIT